MVSMKYIFAKQPKMPTRYAWASCAQPGVEFSAFPSLEFSNCYVDNIDTKTNNINDKHSLIVLIKCRMGFGDSFSG